MVEDTDLHELRLGLPLRPAKELVDLLGGLFAVSNRIDDEPGPVGDVACGKDGWRSGHQRCGINLQSALARGFDALVGFQEREIESEPNGGDPRCRRKDGYRALCSL